MKLVQVPMLCRPKDFQLSYPILRKLFRELKRLWITEFAIYKILGFKIFTNNSNSDGGRGA